MDSSAFIFGGCLAFFLWFDKDSAWRKVLWLTVGCLICEILWRVGLAVWARLG